LFQKCFNEKGAFLLCHKYSPFAFQVRRVRIDQKRKENKKGNLNKREEEKKIRFKLVEKRTYTIFACHHR
jgi:hypothetical protein